MPLPELHAVVVVVGTFLLAGLVKGVVGLGLPTVAVAILTVALGLQEAIALLLIPSLITNLWQGLSGGHLAAILRRFAVFLTAGAVATVLATAALTRVDNVLLSGLLGLLLCLYSGHGLAGRGLAISSEREAWLSPLCGVGGGVLLGMTGSSVVPAVLYLQALGLTRDFLVQTLGVWFIVATVALGTGLAFQGLLPAELGLLSASGLIPALLGMALGQRLRARLSEPRFRQVLFVALLAIGAYLIVRAVL